MTTSERIRTAIYTAIVVGALIAWVVCLALDAVR